MSVVVVDDRMRRLIDPDVQFEELADGFQFVEGPVWHPDGYLLFSDVRGNARYRWDERAGVTRLARPTGHGNGMTLDASARLVVCEGITPAVTRMSADGSGALREVLVDAFRGSLLNSPNDVVVASDGAIYFTDPWSRARVEASADDGCDCSLERELEFQGVFRYFDGQVDVVVDDLEFPNGLCFGTDESQLYVNDTAHGEIHVLQLSAAGSCVQRRLFARGVRGDGGHADGMKCDALGNVWVTAPGGIWVFSPEGERLGGLEFPERVGNFHWGDDGWSSLFVTASTKIYRVRTKVAGRREPFMTDNPTTSEV